MPFCAKTARLIQRHTLSASGIVASFAASLTYVVAGLDSNEVHVLSANGDPLFVLQTSIGTPKCLALEGDCLIGGCASGNIDSWDLKRGRKMPSLKARDGSVSSITFYDPLTVKSSSRDSSIKGCNLTDWTCKHIFNGHTGIISYIAVHESNVATASYDGTCRLWDINTGACQRVLTGHTTEVRAIAFDGNTVVSGGVSGEVCIWNASDGSLKAIKPEQKSIISHIFFECGLIITAGSNAEIVARSLESMEEQWTISRAHTNVVDDLQVRDGIFASCGSDDTIKTWDTRNGCLLREIQCHSQAPWGLRFVGEGQNKVVYTFWAEAAVLAMIE